MRLAAKGYDDVNEMPAPGPQESNW